MFSSKFWNSPFLKNGPIPASFCLFSFFSCYNFNTNWKKHRWCAWDLNPGPQDGRRRLFYKCAIPVCHSLLASMRCLFDLPMSLSLYLPFLHFWFMNQNESDRIILLIKIWHKKKKKGGPFNLIFRHTQKNFFFFLRWWKNKYWINKFLCHPNELNFQLFVFPVLIRSFLSQKHLFN